MKLKILILCCVFGLFIGCANRVSMGYYSSINKNYLFNMNAPNSVVYNANDTFSAYYVDLVVYELQKKGFVSVYKQSDLPLNLAKNAIFMRLFRDIRSSPYAVRRHNFPPQRDRNS